MAQDDGAGAGDAGQSGSGAPEGGSPEGGSENDDKPITAKQLKAALDSQKRHYEGRLDQQRSEFEAFKAGAGTKQAPAQDQPKVYTRAELKAAVDAGTISQEQADAQWDRQRDAELTERAESVALDAVTRRTTKERIDADISAYKRLKPEIMEQGSETRDKISEEFQYLVERGAKKDASTELAAIRAVLGPLEKLENASKARRSADPDQQGGGGEGKHKGGGKGFQDKLTPRWREHYDHAIKQGRYADWKAVEAEAKFATPKRRQEMGLS